MAQVRGYQAKIVDFPEPTDEQLLVPLERIDEEAIRHHLYRSLPIPDLMHWLVDHYGAFQDSTLLKLYHKLIRLSDITATPNQHSVRIVLKQVAIRLHSHVMESE
jgi:hypothetical protein